MRAQAGAKAAQQEAQQEPSLMEQMLREQVLRGALEPAPPETRGYAVRSAGASARAPHRAPRTLRDYPVGQWACVPRRNHLGLGFSTWCRIVRHQEGVLVVAVPGERDQKVPLRLLAEEARATPPPPPAHPTGLKIRIARPCVSMRREAPRACPSRPSGFKIRIPRPAQRPAAHAHMPRVPSPPRALASAPSLAPAEAGGAARTACGVAHVADPAAGLGVAGPGDPGSTTAAAGRAEGATSRGGACTFLPVEYIQVG